MKRQGNLKVVETPMQWVEQRIVCADCGGELWCLDPVDHHYECSHCNTEVYADKQYPHQEARPITTEPIHSISGGENNAD